MHMYITAHTVQNKLVLTFTHIADHSYMETDIQASLYFEEL